MKLFADLKDARWIHIKGWLFLVLAALAGFGLLIQNFSWQNAILLGIGMWAACRWYYYAFYVIEKYVDPGYKFAGIGSFLRYLLARKPSR